MAVLWVNPATGNRFATKHLCLLQGATSIENLVEQGGRIFDERVRASKGNKRLKALYGKTKVTSSTLIVLSTGAFKQLEAKIVANNFATGWYEIPSGAIYDVEATAYDVGIAGSVHLAVRPVVGQAGTHEVWHLQGVNITAYLSAGEGAERQLMTQSFAPQPQQLQQKRQQLNSVTTTVKGGIVVGRPVHAFSAADLRLAAIRTRELDEEEAV